MTTLTPTFSRGYIVDRKHDLIWFLGLPFVAVAAAFLSQRHLPGGALAAIALWVTVPHHFVTWLRVYGSPAEFSRWRERFVLAPIALIVLTYALLYWAPLSLVLVVTLWDHQHSLMQQYGFARVYDFKAKAGAPNTGKFDLYFNWILFANMLVVSPLFSTIWVRMLHEWHLPIGADTVLWVHRVSWTITLVYLAIYIGHILWCVRRGYPLNPLKYLFLGASYFLWYFTSFTTHYLLVYAVAHRIMHGLQYIVMVYFYNRNKVERSGGDSSLLAFLGQAGNAKAFLLMCAAYALVFHALTEGVVRDFGFGMVGFNSNFDLFSYSLLSSFALLHYYYDSFIWKVRKKEVQQGL
ncbi:MAG: hypothetical protein GKR89_05515 [Candidatus Latescibacteria bacterium]|nr:hypothetical protein [Candidatus Latescibacterota bacterium]